MPDVVTAATRTHSSSLTMTLLLKSLTALVGYHALIKRCDFLVTVTFKQSDHAVCHMQVATPSLSNAAVIHKHARNSIYKLVLVVTKFTDATTSIADSCPWLWENARGL